MWRTLDRELNWWIVESGQYLALRADADGIVRSRVYPGLWLDEAALLRMERAALVRCLHNGLASREHEDFVGELAGRRK